MNRNISAAMVVIMVCVGAILMGLVPEMLETEVSVGTMIGWYLLLMAGWVLVLYVQGWWDIDKKVKK